MSEGISVEVLGNYKERYPAKIQFFTNDKEINVRFDECPEILCKLPTDIVHLNIENVKKDIIVGSDVLVYHKVENLSNATTFDDVRLSHAWWPAKVAKLKGCFAAVNFMYRDSDNNSDIVELTALRLMPQSCPISKKDIHSHEMAVPDDLCEFCDQYDLRGDLVRWCGPSIVVNFDRTLKRLQIFSTNKEVVRKASLLDASFMRVLRQKKLIHVQKAELTKKLNDSIRNNYVEEFSVSEELMGLAIGSQGCNIKKAREIDGIINIDLDDRTHTFTITAQNQDSAKQARAQLEYIKDIYYVPEDVVSKVIGKNGNQIQDIIDQSGVMRVRVAQQPHMSNWADEENKHLLEDHVPFIFVGNCNSIRDARLLLEFSIDHHREMDRLQRERDEIHREIRNNKTMRDSRHNSTSEREDENFGHHVARPYNNRGSRGRGGRSGYKNNAIVSHSDVERGDNQYVDESNRYRNNGGGRPGSYRRPMNNNYRQGSVPPMNGGGAPNGGGNRRFYGNQYDDGNTTDEYQSGINDGSIGNKHQPPLSKSAGMAASTGGHNKFRGSGSGTRGGNRGSGSRGSGAQSNRTNNNYQKPPQSQPQRNNPLSNSNGTKDDSKETNCDTKNSNNSPVKQTSKPSSPQPTEMNNPELDRYQVSATTTNA